MDRIITALESQKKDPDRINVYLDHQFAFGISRFVGAWLKTGEQLEDTRIEKLLEQDRREQALQKAMRFIAYQPRSEAEIRGKLEKYGFDTQMIDQVVQELEEKNYLNDARFAQDWVESRSTSKPRSHKFYTYELRKKGIPEDKIAQALESAPDENDLAYQLGCKYLNRYAELDDANFKKKMQGVLARRAFSYDVIKATIGKLLKRRLESRG